MHRLKTAYVKGTMSQPSDTQSIIVTVNEINNFVMIEQLEKYLNNASRKRV